ncbi:MAG: tetratricopeptide repeat protein [Oligoflexia bacterium]|nr:tetratricopeptide repeat protein [Oligoflexia bacterium]
MSSTADARGLKVTFRSLKDATHVEITGQNEWRYDKSQVTVDEYNIVRIQFQGVTPEEIKSLSDLKDQRVKLVTIKAGTNNDALIEFKLADRGMQVFDYQTTDPVNLVFDIYKEVPQPKKSVEKNLENKKINKTHAIKADPLAGLVVRSQVKSKNNQRKIASVDHPELGPQPALLSGASPDAILQLKYGIFDGGDKDLKRFHIYDEDIKESALIKSQENIYLRFPEVIVSQPYLKNILAETIAYEIEPQDDEENQQARLAIKLFKDNKPALVLRTLKFFREKFEKSKYDNVLEYVEADTYFKLWLRDHNRVDFESAMARYKELLDKYPTDPKRYRTLMIVGLNYIDVGNHFGALSAFQVGMTRYPDSPFYWQMRIAVGDALRELNKNDAAIKEFESIENDPRSTTFGVEARYRRGDVYFRSRDYSTAIKEYKEALNRYPTKWALGPNLYFNNAEAQFWLKDYKASLESFRNFLLRFPSHEHGGYAMTRIGEILEILGAPKHKVTGAYLESYFRYRGSPGAYLAKVRFNSERFGNMKEKELNAARKEFKDEMPEGKMEHVDTFVKLAEADGLLLRKNFDASFDILVKFYQSNTLSPHLFIFKNRIVNNLTEKIAFYNSKKDYVKALDIYLHNTDSWLLKSSRIDTRYFAGKAYEGLNILDESAKYYTQCLVDYEVLTPERLRYSKAFENLPSPDQLNLRLAKVSYESNQFKKADDHLGKIVKLKDMSDAERVERSLILASVAEKSERFDLAELALKDLTEQWKGQPSLLVEPWYRLAKLSFDQNKNSEALGWVQKLNTVSQENTDIKPEIIRKGLELAADIHLKEGKPNEAGKAYKLILEKHHAGMPTASVRYRLGKIYFDQKNFGEATKIWNVLKEDKNAALWEKMAQEQLAQIQWNEKYKRYVDRKPAGGKK